MMGQRTIRGAVSALLSGAVAGASFAAWGVGLDGHAVGVAHAQGGAADAKAIAQRVASSDAATIATGLTEAKDAGASAKAAAASIEALLGRGTTPALAVAAIDALGAIGSGSSSAVIAPYLRHRNAEVRRAAVRALAETKGKAAIEAFRGGLRSSDGMVRGFSATGLGNLGGREAMDDLFKALERNVTESAAAIGQLCVGEECTRFSGYLGKVTFDVMTSGFDPILFRDKPLPEKDQLYLVGVIRELGTPEAGQYLADVAGRWPAQASAKVKQALDQAVSSIPGASGGAK